MVWGSQWATIRTTGTTPFHLFQWSNWFALRLPRTEPYHTRQWNRTEPVLVVTDDLRANLGGTRFNGLNPLLRVRSGDVESVTPVLDLPTDTTTSTSTEIDVNYEHEHEHEHEHEPEGFDRQQSNSERKADTRLPRRHRISRVPSVDDRSAVAFQNLLSDSDREELEFLLLVAASIDDECCYQ